MSEAAARLAAALAGRYAIERELGQGGMATVYLAEDVRHHRRVAVKVLRAEIAATLGANRFFREIEVAARLQHPNILPLLDSGEAGDLLYYVMPYVEGESLRDRLARQGELPVHDAVRILIEVTDALAHAHANGVVHRDIKPDNIMLSGRHALVTDFGVAKAVSEATGRQTITTAGVALGTPTYMAPEQAVADPHLDHRVDIYAVGVLGYELLTGRAPFSVTTPQEMLVAHVTREPEPIDRHREGLSPALTQVLMKCLAKRPADRWQTADELLAQLEPLATPSGGITPTQSRPAVAGRGTPRRLLWGAGTLAVAAVAVMLTLLMSRQPPTLVLGRRVAVATGPDLETWPSLSRDGRLVAYMSRGRSGWTEVVRQVDGGLPVTVAGSRPGPIGFGALSPAGDRLLIATPDGIVTVPALGGQMRLVANLAAGLSPDASFPRNTFLMWAAAWNPGGTRLAYTSQDTLFSQSLDGTARAAVATGRELHSPAWSGDGRWIAYVEGNPQFHTIANLAPSAIRVVRASGGTPVAVTDNGSLNTSPVWVPGRRALLFISDRDGGRDVYEVFLRRSGEPAGAPARITTGLNPERLSLSADGRWLAWSAYTETANLWSLPIPGRDSVLLSEAQQVTTGEQNIENVSPSPDGAWLYYDSDRSGVSHIWRQRLGGGLPEQLTNDSAADFDPAVSPDGREVAFHSFRTGNRDIFVMPAAGGAATQVTTRPAHDWNPGWLDDRTLIWDEQLNPGDLLWTAQRNPDGSWGSARPWTVPGLSAAAVPRPSPDGRWVAVNESGLKVIDVATRAVRVVSPVPGYVAWSADSRTLYFATDPDSTGHWTIRSVSPRGGAPRTLAYGNDPLTQGRRFGFALAGGRFYFPVVERKGDIWVAEVRQR
jgi:Tol biopolymer transport system component/tRNA A-37 threonylcarbamoyl transferase component Bud32